MDKNGKVFGKISILDILVLVIIIIAAIAVIYRFSSPGASFNANNTKIRYTLRIDNVRDFTYEYYLKEPDLVCRDKNTGKYIGRIVSVGPKEPFYEAVEDSDGVMRKYEKPGMMSATIEIEADGTVTDTAYYAEATFEIKAGSEIYLCTKYVEVISTVESVWAK